MTEHVCLHQLAEGAQPCRRSRFELRREEESGSADLHGVSAGVKESWLRGPYAESNRVKAVDVCSSLEKVSRLSELVAVGSFEQQRPGPRAVFVVHIR